MNETILGQKMLTIQKPEMLILKSPFYKGRDWQDIKKRVKEFDKEIDAYILEKNVPLWLRVNERWFFERAEKLPLILIEINGKRIAIITTIEFGTNEWGFYLEWAALHKDNAD